MKKRQYGVDIIKIIGSALVIAVHHYRTMGFYNIPYNGGMTMYLTTALYIVALSCVPLFLISTGYLLSSREIESTHYKKIFYFFIEVILIYLIINTLNSINSDNFSIEFIFRNTLKQFFSPNYYVGLYFSLYMLVPFFNKFFMSLEDDHKKIFMLVLILVISLPKTLNTVFGITFFDIRPTQMWTPFYYFVGLYIRYFQPKLKKSKNIVFLFLTMILYSLLMNWVLAGDIFNYNLGYYENIFAFSSSVLIFLFWYDVDIKNNILKKILTVISSMTLTFYIAGGLYSDPKVLELINLTGTLRLDFITIVPVVFLSFLYSLPIGLAVHYLLKIIYKYTYEKILHSSW